MIVKKPAFYNDYKSFSFDNENYVLVSSQLASEYLHSASPSFGPMIHLAVMSEFDIHTHRIPSTVSQPWGSYNTFVFSGLDDYAYISINLLDREFPQVPAMSEKWYVPISVFPYIKSTDGLRRGLTNSVKFGFVRDSNMEKQDFVDFNIRYLPKWLYWVGRPHRLATPRSPIPDAVLYAFDNDSSGNKNKGVIVRYVYAKRLREHFHDKGLIFEDHPSLYGR